MLKSLKEGTLGHLKTLFVHSKICYYYNERRINERRCGLRMAQATALFAFLSLFYYLKMEVDICHVNRSIPVPIQAVRN